MLRKRQGGKIKLQAVEVIKLDDFNYQGSTTVHGQFTKELRERVQADWNG